MAGRLLLVGESSDELTDLRGTFEGIGLTVEIAPDGLAGLETGKEFQPDLVVTEILINRLSGFELASRISGGTAGFAAPVIFYTEFYRDEKARREVVGKYGALQYFVRPFQKDALKKLVIAHFQDFLSNLPRVPVVESTPVSELAGNDAEVNSAEPQLSRAAAVAEKQAPHPDSGTLQPANLGGFSGEMPSRFGGFSPAEQTDSREGDEPKPQSANPAVDQTENQTNKVVATVPVGRREAISTPPRAVRHHEPSLLLPVEEPSLIGRLLQSKPLRLAAVVIVVALAIYLVLGRFQGGDDDQPPQQSATPELGQPAAATPTDTGSAPPTATAVAPPPTRQELPAAVEPGKGASEPTTPLAAAPAKTEDAAQENEVADSREAARDRSPSLSIQDVTGSGRGPVLRRMKPVQLSQDVLNSLAAKAVVIRVVIDREGKVTEVTPLNQEEGTASLPADALAAIQQWEFSRSRRKDAPEAVKYFSLKVQNPRQ
jgi:DNA-binding response OmpR family regulator